MSTTMWSKVQPGEDVSLRPKRVLGDTISVTVDQLLERELGGGLGLVSTDGVTYRQWFYDVSRTDHAAAEN